MLIGEVLRDLGYGCVEVGDGQAALPILASDIHLDLLITDVGFARHERPANWRLRRASGGPGLKVLFVTGYAERAL